MTYFATDPESQCKHLSDPRLEQLISWLSAQLDNWRLVLKPASTDASFRRYFRVWCHGATYIAMDAPPERENSLPFVNVARLLKRHGLLVPTIYDYDLQRGFMLLSDLGEQTYLAQLDNDSADKLYSVALDALVRMQIQVPCETLPEYSANLLNQELQLFTDWFLQRHLHMNLGAALQQTLQDTYHLLVDNALQQPVTFVHRDYHSRNLMVTDSDQPGILDFQDAVSGPITYDAVSLLRDCYIAWPEDRITVWLENYYQQLKLSNAVQADWPQFQHWFDWMGIQRHLKAIGIFARLHHRDNKSGYLNDIPRTLNYVFAVSQRYPELNAFSRLIKKCVQKVRPK